MSFPTGNCYNTRSFRRDPELIPAIGSGAGITRQTARSSVRPSRVVVPRVVTVEGRLPRLASRHVRTPYSRNTRDAERRISQRPSTPTLLPCPICLEEMHPRNSLNVSCLKCGHVFCTDCIIKWTSIKHFCPTCHESVNDPIIRLFLQ